MYVGRKRKAEPLSGAVRLAFQLRHSPRQCTMQPNMAEHSLSRGMRITSFLSSEQMREQRECAVDVCMCRPLEEMSKQVEIFPLLI